MVSFPNAKINIGLNILRKRPDGFHDLESFFVPVAWCDILEIIPHHRLEFTSSGREIPPDPKGNLCIQAYELLKKDFDLPPVHIHLHKVIPIGAGLGGGSADASFTLNNLNQQFDLGLPSPQLEDYARQLGSDCPFFVENTPKFGEGRGDEFSDLCPSSCQGSLLMIYPKLHISTKEAYQAIKPQLPAYTLKESLQLPMDTWKDRVHNGFEDGLFQKYPQLAEIKQNLYKLGAIYASMSGSGSCLYGIFSGAVETSIFSEQNYELWQGDFQL